MERATFREQYLNGLCQLDCIEEYTERWHHGDGKHLSLKEYLGLNQNEYEVYICQGREALATMLKFR